MPNKPKTYRPSGKTPEQRRGSAASRGYGWKWRNPNRTGAADRFLQENPLCVECKREGKICPATVVDHIRPHRGNQRLFWDERNWQGLCETHHNRKTAQGF